MQRRDFIAGLFAGANAVAHGAKPEELLLPGSVSVGGDLKGLTHKGKLFSELNGQVSLVYFGTAHSLPVCAVDLMQIEEVAGRLRKRCGEKIVPVFIYPETKAAAPIENLKQYVERPNSIFLGLSGKQDQVLDLAARYKARYFFDRASGAINNHTRFVYLMGPDGKNLGIVQADLMALIPLETYLERIKRSGVSTAPACTF